MSPSGREIVRERLAQGLTFEALRRGAVIKWVSDLRENAPERVEWGTRPPMLDETHWQDLQTGALFFPARDAAIGLLDQIERTSVTKATKPPYNVTLSRDGSTLILSNETWLGVGKLRIGAAVTLWYGRTATIPSRPARH
jgi:hypothetical protein